jgi:hypothetical protein
VLLLCWRATRTTVYLKRLLRKDDATGAAGCGGVAAVARQANLSEEDARAALAELSALDTESRPAAFRGGAPAFDRVEGTERAHALTVLAAFVRGTPINPPARGQEVGRAPRAWMAGGAGARHAEGAIEARAGARTQPSRRARAHGGGGRFEPRKGPAVCLANRRRGLSRFWFPEPALRWRPETLRPMAPKYCGPEVR